MFIVDTPGIGESDEMTGRLTDYLPNAIAFIFVINRPNAGGLQKDRVIQPLRFIAIYIKRLLQY